MAQIVEPMLVNRWPSYSLHPEVIVPPRDRRPAAPAAFSLWFEQLMRQTEASDC
jgi:hypothetical protein